MVNAGLRQGIQLGSEECTVAGSEKTMQKRKMLGIWAEFQTLSNYAFGKLHYEKIFNNVWGGGGGCIWAEIL